jgi:hypothetical protein
MDAAAFVRLIMGLVSRAREVPLFGVGMHV